MVDINKINLASMHIMPIYRRILEHHNKYVGLPLIETLEDYKILNRDSIIAYLNELVTDKNDFVYNVTDDMIYTSKNVINVLDRIQTHSLDGYAELTKDIFRYKIKVDKPQSLLDIEREYNVYSEIIDSKIYIFQALGQTINKDLIIIKLVGYQVRFITVTPVNLRELQCKPAPKKDLLLLFRRFIVACMEAGASNLKFQGIYVNRKPVIQVLFRVDDTMVEYTEFPLTVSEEEDMIKQVVDTHSSILFSELDARATDGSLGNVIFDDRLECRFGCSKMSIGFLFNVRLRMAESVERKVNELNLDKYTVEVIEYTIQKLSGFTLVTGPMSSGKSTTLWGMMTNILENPVSCIEYSSPVEAKMPLPQTDYRNNLIDLQQKLATAKKQDLNYVFLNEIPTGDVSRCAHDLANSNVHVISTLHLGRIWELPHKLYDYHGRSYKDILSCYNLVVNQKLFIKQCPHCSYEIATINLPTKIREFLKENNITKVKENKGCKYCQNGQLKGGRKPYTEWLLFTDDVIARLRACNSPSEMEEVIKDIVRNDKEYIEKEVSLDVKLIKEIKAGNLSYRCLYDIL